MTNPIAGWYPDPSGDKTKLRWWDGNQWTDNYADAVAPQQPAQAQPQQARVQQPVQPQAQQLQAQAQPQPQPQPQPAQSQQSAQGFAQPQQAAQPQPQPQGYGAQGYGQAYNPAPQQPGQPYAQAQSASTDDTLRLIAFILAVISTVSVCWAIIPLAWMIPMTVHCWGIYKRTKENTTAFGVCTLIFLNLIGGILLLVSTRSR